MDLSTRFVEHVREADLYAGGPVLVACSGGADSTALVRLAASAADALRVERVGVAHLDHGLRNGSEADARFVRDLAAELRLTAFVERRAVRPGSGESPEAAARRERYGFLAEVARREGFPVVATAHHMDDQAETVLFRALTGTGIRGLAGVRPSRPLAGDGPPTLVRPLLPFRASELRTWLADAGHAWREDPSNADGNPRARLRHVAFPVLARSVDRDPVPLLARLADVARDDASARSSIVELAAAWVLADGDGITLAAGHERLPPELLAAALARPLAAVRGDASPPSHAEIGRLVAATRVGAGGESVRGVEVLRSGAEVRIVAAGTSAQDALEDLELTVPGHVHAAGMRISAEHALPETSLFVRRLRARSGALELLDAGRVVSPLAVGPPRAASFIPLGAAAPVRLGGFLQRRGLDARARAGAPVVYDAEGPVWVVGHRIAERVRLREGTRRALVLEVDAG